MRTKRRSTSGELQDSPEAWIKLIEQQFGKLTVIGFTGARTAHGQKMITCQCSCDDGWYVDVMPASLRSGATTSCGCAHSAAVQKHNVELSTHGHARGGKVTPEYAAWHAMINRCHNPKDSRYKWYGALGVVVCTRWRESFENFLADMGLRPSALHSLDRYPNNAGNYEPVNVRWATSKEQGRNQRGTKRYEINGEKLTLGEWAERSQISHERLYSRVVRYGWSIAEAIQVPVAAPLEREDLYGRWWQMVHRCTDPSHERYADYGGRGITVCARWQNSFDAFVDDMGLPPTPTHTIDRWPNNDGGYAPGNARWATPIEQNRNRRNTKLFELKGQIKTLSEWAELAGVPYERVRQRVHGGWALDEALGTPVGNMGRMPKGARKKWILA